VGYEEAIYRCFSRAQADWIGYPIDRCRVGEQISRYADLVSYPIVNLTAYSRLACRVGSQTHMRRRNLATYPILIMSK